MNVGWHRPSQTNSAFMYIFFRMSSNGTRGSAISKPAHDDGLITRVNIQSATHDLCHPPTHRGVVKVSRAERRRCLSHCVSERKAHVTPLCITHSLTIALFDLFSFLHTGHWCGHIQHHIAGTLVDQDLISFYICSFFE